MRTDRSIAVVDIDGVIADVRHRTPLITGSNKAWDAFYSSGHRDPIYKWGAVATKLLATVYDVCYLTGMPERYREERTQWLGRAGVPFGILEMRGDRDWRPAWEYKWVKIEKIQQRTGQKVEIVLDDDPRITNVLSVIYPDIEVIWVNQEEIDDDEAAAEGEAGAAGD